MDLDSPGGGCQSQQEGLWISLVDEAVGSLKTEYGYQAKDAVVSISRVPRAFPGIGRWGVMEESRLPWSRMWREGWTCGLIKKLAGVHGEIRGWAAMSWS